MGTEIRRRREPRDRPPHHPVQDGAGAKRDAQRELRAILTGIDGGTYTDPSKMTLAAMAQQWLDEAQHNVARKTLERYREIVERHLVPALGAIPLGKLQPVHIQAYYTQALATGRRDGTGGLSAQTVVHHDRVLNVALKRARALRLIATNPIEDVSRPKVPRQEIAVLEPAEAAALLTTARSTRMFPLSSWRLPPACVAAKSWACAGPTLTWRGAR